ncbi:LicD family-domain-containing protein [Xylariomycetidae sp. FL0641]|nr:LicD family-domain-containing protein [Xylariomycetidae sp. FL0641]
MTPLVYLTLIFLAGAAASPPVGWRYELPRPVESWFQKITSLIREPSSNPSGKYFHESTFHSHYDGRFATEPLDEADQVEALKSLSKAYLHTFSELGMETWLAHGTLMGWWWNNQIMPWDSDVDFQVTEATMDYLAAKHNMSLYPLEPPIVPQKRTYMLDINPYYSNPNSSDVFNKIDARWIDISTGLFIDITAIHTNRAKGREWMRCKDGHEYKAADLFPLRDTVFEGVPAKVPWHYEQILVAEYGKASVTKASYHGHVFDATEMRWVPNRKRNHFERRQSTSVGNAPAPTQTTALADMAREANGQISITGTPVATPSTLLPRAAQDTGIPMGMLESMLLALLSSASFSEAAPSTITQSATMTQATSTQISAGCIDDLGYDSTIVPMSIPCR